MNSLRRLKVLEMKLKPPEEIETIIIHIHGRIDDERAIGKTITINTKTGEQHEQLA